MEKLVSLPFLVMDVISGDSTGSVSLEAYISKYARPEEACLLSNVTGLEESRKSGGLYLSPWGTPREVLDHYVSLHQELERPVDTGDRDRWPVRGLSSYLQRLMVGGLAESLEIYRAPRHRIIMGVARGLCRRSLGFINPYSYQIVASRTLWKSIYIVGEGDSLEVLTWPERRKDKVFTYLAGSNRLIRQEFLKLLVR